MFMKQQKGLLLISGGIDSPIAGYLMQKKGVEISAIHFSKGGVGLEKARALVKLLATNYPIKLYVADHTHFMEEIVTHCDKRFACVLCKRMMFRVAEKIAQREKYDFLVTGCNLGQVASQTLDNIGTTSSAVKIMILRPLLCYDKQETMDLAKEIGTYETSIIKSPDCVYVPTHPVTKARKDFVEREELRIDVNKLVEDTLNSVVVEEIK